MTKEYHLKRQVGKLCSFLNISRQDLAGLLGIHPISIYYDRKHSRIERPLKDALTAQDKGYCIEAVKELLRPETCSIDVLDLHSNCASCKATKLPENSIKEKDDVTWIKKIAVPIVWALSGLYFLIEEQQILYIGCTSDLYPRIYKHRLGKERIDALGLDPCQITSQELKDHNPHIFFLPFIEYTESNIYKYRMGEHARKDTNLDFDFKRASILETIFIYIFDPIANKQKTSRRRGRIIKLNHTIIEDAFELFEPPLNKLVHWAEKRLEQKGFLVPPKPVRKFPNSVLTENQVLAIRSQFKTRQCSMSSLATEYNITPSTVRQIVLGRTWKHLL